jgi:phosphatidate cytidylyltransferase
MLHNLTPTVALTLLGIVVLLVACTLTVSLIVRLNPHINFDELKMRTRTWWVMVTVMLLATVTGKVVSLVFLGFVSYLALKEYLSLIPTRRSDRAILIFVYAAIPLQTCLAATGQADLLPVFVPLYVLLFMSTTMVLKSPTHGFLYAAGTVSFGMMLILFGLGFVSCLIILPDSGNPVGGATGLVVYLVFLVQFNDVVQYVAGKAVGRHRVLPGVSPNKTWEGLVGGFLVTIALALFLAPLLTPFGRAEALVAGALIAVGGFAGDATVSAIKRDIGVGDTGNLLPGHGGVLDRVDSLIFAAPLFYYYVHQLYF